MGYLEDNVRIIQWSEARERVCSVNPRLASLIDDFNPSKEHEFIEVSYRYGQPIMHKGQIHLPISPHKTVPLDHKDISKQLKQQLSYSFVPAAIILNKKSEVFYESQDRIMPTKVFNAGAMFGLWEMFDPPPSHFVEHVWSIIAGTRSSFLLPKIGNQFSHKRLQRELGITAYAPHDLLQHHQVFKEIAANVETDTPWTMKLLFFGRKWQGIISGENFTEVKLCHFLLQEAWRQSSNCRNNMSFDMAWELFSKAVAKRNMKPKPLIVNTLKHLLAIHDGYYPGYAVAINDDCAPVSIITDTYQNIYKTQSYPTFMEPIHLSKANRPVYYSLQMPTLLEYAPGSQGKNIITDLRELKMLTDMMEDAFKQEFQRFTFYHTETDNSLNIHMSEQTYEDDDQFLITASNVDKEPVTFASNSPFLKGCIKIALENDRTIPLAIDAVF